MRLLCEFGWHKAAPFPRWKDGYYLSKCERCGRDLARGEHGGWAPLGRGGTAPTRRAPAAALLLGAAIAVAALMVLVRSTAPVPEEEPPQPHPTPVLDRPTPAPQPRVEPPPPQPVIARPSPAPKPRVEPPPPQAAPAPALGRASVARRIVTASLVNCRTGPSERAPVEMRLRKGTPVSLLETRAAWSRISYRQRPCWARDRYIAPAVTPPSEQGERAHLEPLLAPTQQGD